MGDWLIGRDWFHIATLFLKRKFLLKGDRERTLRPTHQFTVVMLTVAAVLDIVQVIASLFTQKTQLLCTCHVELLLASRLITLHACTSSCLRSFPAIGTDVTC